MFGDMCVDLDSFNGELGISVQFIALESERDGSISFLFGM